VGKFSNIYPTGEKRNTMETKEPKYDAFEFKDKDDLVDWIRSGAPIGQDNDPDQVYHSAWKVAFDNEDYPEDKGYHYRIVDKLEKDGYDMTHK